MHNQTNERTVFNLNELGISRCFQFGHYRYTHVRPELENHLHRNTLELCFYLKGEQFYVVDDEIFRLTGNDILIVPPNTSHSTGSYPEDKGELFWIQISLDKNKGKLCNTPHEQMDYVLHRLIDASNFVFKGAYSLKPILEKLLNTLQAPKNPLAELTINQVITQLLLDTLSLAEQPQKVTSSKRMDSLNHFIKQQIHRTIYMDELADLIHVSTPYFKNWFKEQTGIPPGEYINRQKIEKAKKDLLNKESVTTVALDLGFSTSQYFATTFKKFTGHTPSKFKKLNISEPELE